MAAAALVLMIWTNREIAAIFVVMMAVLVGGSLVLRDKIGDPA